MRARRSRPCFPAWGYPLIASGGLITYLVAGEVLHSPDFLRELPIFLTSPGTLAEAGPERIAPFILLLIPAVLGGLGTRAILLRVLDGMARRESVVSIALAVGSLLLAGIVYVLLALFSSSRKGH